MRVKAEVAVCHVLPPTQAASRSLNHSTLGDLKAKCQRIASNPAPRIVYQYIYATIPVQYGVQRVEYLSPEGREGKAKKPTKKKESSREG